MVRSIDVLRENGYTDCDLVDMYSVLQNHAFRDVEEIVAGSAKIPSGRIPDIKIPNVEMPDVNAPNGNAPNVFAPNLKANA